MAREKFRVDKNVAHAKKIVHTGQHEVQDMKAAAKRKYRRRSNQILKQADTDNGDELDILSFHQELSGWDIA